MEELWDQLENGFFGGELFGGQLMLAPLGLIAYLVISSYRSKRRKAAEARLARQTMLAQIASATPPDPVTGPTVQKASTVSSGGYVDPFNIPPPRIRSAEYPSDESFYQTVREFAQAKLAQGEPLNEQETFLLGPVAVVDAAIGEEGLAHLDQYRDGMPHRGWELREAMDRIGTPEVGAVIEDAMSVYLHRLQLTKDFMATGMPFEQVLAHPDLPTYDALEARLDQLGGQTAMHAKLNVYLKDAYPWSKGFDR